MLSLIKRFSLSDSKPCPKNYVDEDADVRLMLLVQKGDANAFEELVLRYQNRLIGVLEHLVGRKDLAEDLAQEVFLRVYRARARYQPNAKFSTWLFTIANNLASNARRSLARRREVHIEQRGSEGLTGDPLAQLALAASGLMPNRQLDNMEACSMVQQAIQGLNDRQRMAVLLAKFEDMSYADIAEVMQLSPQAVKSLISRARGSLRETLAVYVQSGKHPRKKS